MGVCRNIWKNIISYPRRNVVSAPEEAQRIFALRMIMEIARVKQHPVYVLFVDLAKAYDSVHRETLWKVLERKGVPARLIALIREFFTGKEARVSVEGTVSNSFSLNTGLGQGCCLAPTLFNIFLAAVMEDWLSRVEDPMHWVYRIDGILGRHVDDASLAKYSRWETVTVHDLGYADDSAFLAASCEQLARYALQLQQQYTGWGLNLSVPKTEAMATTGAHGHDSITVSPDSEGHKCIKYTDVFKYHGQV